MTIVIDPGHSACPDPEQEPIGPGASETKARSAPGTMGVKTDIPEHEFNLALAFMLRDILTERGCNVILTRESADECPSNSERAEIANAAGADAMISLHANAHKNPKIKGAQTLCRSPANPYNPELYPECRRLAEWVHWGVVKRTGCRDAGVHENDGLTVQNHCRVPMAILEAGFMTCPGEDVKLSRGSYRRKIAEGAADGIMKFIGTCDNGVGASARPPRLMSVISILRRLKNRLWRAPHRRTF